MRRAACILTAGLLVLVAGGCSAEAGDDAVGGPTSTTPELEVGSPSPSVTGEPTPASTTAAPTTAPPRAPTPTPVPPTAAAPVPQDVSEAALLDADTLGSADQPREVDPAVRAWVLPDACGTVVPDAAAMLTVTQGTGEMERVVRLHQVAVFPDAEAAVAAADALAAALAACVDGGQGTQTRYVREDVPVGAQGHGLAVDYYGASPERPLDDAIGRYLVTTRRGSAVTLVGTLSGEATVGPSRAQVVTWAHAAWERLCVYAVAGC